MTQSQSTIHSDWPPPILCHNTEVRRWASASAHNYTSQFPISRLIHQVWLLLLWFMYYFPEGNSEHTWNTMQILFILIQSSSHLDSVGGVISSPDSSDQWPACTCTIIQWWGSTAAPAALPPIITQSRVYTEDCWQVDCVWLVSPSWPWTMSQVVSWTGAGV